MAEVTERAKRAYENIEFLNSMDARTIRILAEYLEPLQRFTKEKVKDTIVFFGSARLKPEDEAAADVHHLTRQLKHPKLHNRELVKQELVRAKKHLREHHIITRTRWN